MADRLGQINPSGFVGNAPIVVEPRAVQALSEAFRSGLIRADEVADRAMLRPAQQAAANLAADPQLVEAKRRDILAGATQAETQAQMGQLALKQAQQQAAIPPIIQQQNSELATKGLQVFPDTGGVWTPAKSVEVSQLWKDLKTWEAEFSSAVAQDKSLKEVDITRPTGAVEKISYEEGSQRQAEPARAAAVKDWIRANASPRQWIQSGKPPSPSLFGPAPGEISAPAPQQIAPEILSGQRAPGFDARPTPLPGAATTPSTTTFGTAPAPTAAPASAAQPSGGLVVKPAGLAGKSPTEKQGQAMTATARMISADEVLQNLQAKGFNPGAAQNWLQDYLVGPFEALKSSDKKTYDAAASSWIQGLLRLESGAAIAAKEQKWYENTFFPRPGDPPAVQNIKASLRSDIEKIVSELARGGGLDVATLLNVRDKGEILNASPAAGGAVEQTTIDGKQYRIDRSSGRAKLIPMNAQTAPTVQPYRQPDRLGGGASKPVVEPKGKTPMKEPAGSAGKRL